MMAHECQMCRQSLGWNARNNKKFCSATCRKRWSRRGDALKLASGEIMYQLGQVRMTIKQWDDLTPDAIQILNRMKAEINDLLLLAREPDAMAKVGMLYERSRSA